MARRELSRLARPYREVTQAFFREQQEQVGADAMLRRMGWPAPCFSLDGMSTPTGISKPLGRGWMNALAGAALCAVACSQPTPEDAARARAGVSDRADALADSIPDIVQARVPAALAGDAGWAYQQQVIVDLDNDGTEETAVLISDVRLDAQSRPLWEDGHRWQVYVREPDGHITRLYARFLPNGRLTAELTVPASGTTRGLVLLEQTPHRIAVYEFRYRGPNRAEVYRRLERDLDPTKTFMGSPRP